MNTEILINPNDTGHFAKAPALQGCRTAGYYLAALRAHRRPCAPRRVAPRREWLRAVRAAELALWELTGGDVLSSFRTP